MPSHPSQRTGHCSMGPHQPGTTVANVWLASFHAKGCLEGVNRHFGSEPSHPLKGYVTLLG